MRLRPRVLLCGVLATLSLGAQQTATTVPARFLYLVRQTLNPGRARNYQTLEAEIARGYAQARVQAYWIESQALTGPPEVTYLNLFDAFNQLDQAGASIAAALPGHPELAQQADQLLQENVAGEYTTLLDRRDDLSFRPTGINFARMRVLRMITVEVRPGHDSDFATAARSFAVQGERDGFTPPWVVYQTQSGASQPAYVILSAFPGLSALDTPAARRNPFLDNAVESFLSVESRLYTVNPAASHVSPDFAAADPGFWTSHL